MISSTLHVVMMLWIGDSQFILGLTCKRTIASVLHEELLEPPDDSDMSRHNYQNKGQSHWPAIENMNHISEQMTSSLIFSKWSNELLTISIGIFRGFPRASLKWWQKRWLIISFQFQQNMIRAWISMQTYMFLALTRPYSTCFKTLWLFKFICSSLKLLPSCFYLVLRSMKAWKRSLTEPDELDLGPVGLQNGAYML